MRVLPNGMKIGNATVIVDIVKRGNTRIRPGIPMSPRGATDHDTGNNGIGADAHAHNRLLHNWGNLPVIDTSHVSWHISLDEKFIIQTIPFDEPAYHCGDGWLPNSGNRTTIGIEKCMHRGANRELIEANAIALYAYLMKEFKFPITEIKPHQAWSGKYCPALILNKYGSFRPFRNKIEAMLYSKPAVVQVSNKVHTVAAGQTLGAIAKSHGVSVDTIAKANNVKNPNFIYVNQRLVIPGSEKTVAVKPKPVPKPAASKPKQTNSIVEYLQSLGQPSSLTARKALAPKYGIPNYTGTAAQNRLLLDRIRSNWKAPTKEYVQLPASAASWRLYPTNKAPVKGNEMETLKPAKFGGLEYEVVGKPQANIVTINTSQFGRGNIFIGPGTGAKIVRK